jgi:hypothetical protein
VATAGFEQSNDFDDAIIREKGRSESRSVGDEVSFDERGERCVDRSRAGAFCHCVVGQRLKAA